MQEELRQLWDYVLTWNTPGTLGDVLPLAVGALTGAVGILYGGARTRAARKREQALQVSAWIERTAEGTSLVRVRNSSRQRIDQVLVAVCPTQQEPKQAGVWNRDAQLFTAQTVGPERSVEFPLRATFKNHIEYELQLHFVDRDGRGWLMDEAGKLRRQREPIGIAPFSGVTTGQQGEVTDHSAAVPSSGQAVELEGMPIARLDFDAADGNNVSSLFLPKGQTMPSSSIVELRRDDGAMAARVFLDEQFKILKITICNLPKDTRHFAFPRYFRTDEAFHVLLGRREDSLDELVNGKHTKETEILGGNHVPGGELAQVAYDDVGHLAAISVNNNKLVAGFLQD